jgi:hypothetical protein
VCYYDQTGLQPYHFWGASVLYQVIQPPFVIRGATPLPSVVCDATLACYYVSTSSELVLEAAFAPRCDPVYGLDCNLFHFSADFVGVIPTYVLTPIRFLRPITIAYVFLRTAFARLFKGLLLLSIPSTQLI